jgi:uncharacterized DUF497 family protein
MVDFWCCFCYKILEIRCLVTVFLRKALKFEWDTTKYARNVEEHGVRFEDACYAFSDPCGLSLYDEAHSDAEKRWILMARSPLSGRLLILVHTYNHRSTIEVVRIISARRANKHEAATYQGRARQ